MKESKIALFENCSELVLSRRLKSLEDEGWEVKEHTFAVMSGLTSTEKYVTVLLQRERVE